MADTWEALVAEAQAKTDKILERDVAPVVKKIIKNQIDQNVYGSYTPAGKEQGGYERRGELSDERNLIAETEDGELFVTSVASPSPSIFSERFQAPLTPYESRLLQWIEFGRVPNYFNHQSYPWTRPRPVISAAQEEMDNSTELDTAIKSGIQKEF